MVVFSIILTLAYLAVIADTIHKIILSAKDVRTEGYITKLEKQKTKVRLKGGKQATVHYTEMLVEYRADNKAYTISDIVKKKKVSIGDTVKVRYNPKKPEDATFTNRAKENIPAVIVIGILTLVFDYLSLSQILAML